MHRPPAVLDAGGRADAVRRAHAWGCRSDRVLRRRNGVEAVRAQLRSGLGAVPSRRASRLGRVPRGGRCRACRGLRSGCRADSALARAADARGRPREAPFTGWPPPASTRRFEIGNPAIYNRTPMSLDRTCAHSCPQKCRHAAPDRLSEVDVGGRHRTPDHVLFGGGSAGGAVLRRDAIRSEGSAEPGERPVRAVEGPRRADSVLRAGPRRARSTAPIC